MLCCFSFRAVFDEIYIWETISCLQLFCKLSDRHLDKGYSNGYNISDDIYQMIWRDIMPPRQRITKEILLYY